MKALADSTVMNKEDIIEIADNVNKKKRPKPRPRKKSAKHTRIEVPQEDVTGTTSGALPLNKLSPLEPEDSIVRPVFVDVSDPTHLDDDDEIVLKNTRTLPLPASNNGTHIALDAPSIFETLPASSVSMNASTPVPSPLNTHTDCQDSFCPLHDDGHRTSRSYTYVPVNSSEDEAPAPSKRGYNKRLCRTSEWSDVKRKNLKNVGKSYVTKRGKVVNEKTLGPPCRCKFRCFEKITHDQRYECFQNFWQLGSREKQWDFVVNHTIKKEKNRTTNRKVPNNRRFTFKYFLPLNASSEEGLSEVDVCKTMFLNTFSVNSIIVKTAWDKYDGTVVKEDKRGRHINHRQTNPDTVKSVCDHVRSFVPVDPHCFGKDSMKLYLDGRLSIPKMYRMYNDWFDSSIYSSKAGSVRQYRDLVNKNFNLEFYVPKKDQSNFSYFA